MEVVDTKKLETALLYLQRITEGRNPVNNMPAEDDSVINNPNVVRCMFFIKEVLEELKRNDGYIGRRPKANKDSTKMDYPIENLRNFVYTEDKPISKLVEQLNNTADMTVYKKLSYKPIIEWLKENGYLETKHTDQNRTVTMPTEKGRSLGIRAEARHNEKTSYDLILYSEQAQKFIVENMDEIMKESVKGR